MRNTLQQGARLSSPQLKIENWKSKIALLSPAYTQRCAQDIRIMDYGLKRSSISPDNYSIAPRQPRGIFSVKPKIGQEKI